jgi:hypothetical protein
VDNFGDKQEAERMRVGKVYVLKAGTLAANEVPREKLLLDDVTQMFWELRKLREENKELKEINRRLKISNYQLDRKNQKLEYANAYLDLSNM